MRQPAAALIPQPAVGETLAAPCQQAGYGKRQQAARSPWSGILKIFPSEMPIISRYLLNVAWILN